MHTELHATGMLLMWWIVLGAIALMIIGGIISTLINLFSGSRQKCDSESNEAYQLRMLNRQMFLDSIFKK